MSCNILKVVLEGLVNDFEEEKRMPLYLDEIYFNISSKEEYKQVCERMTNNMSKCATSVHKESLLRGDGRTEA